MVTPTDPRDRLPPLLRRYCPNRETIERQHRLWVGKARTFLTRFASACTRGWSAVDGTGRLSLVCIAGVVLLTALLPSFTLWCAAIVALLVFPWRARHWQELDSRGRLLVIGGNTAAIIALVLATAGPGDHKDRPERYAGTMEGAHVTPAPRVIDGETAEEYVTDPRMVEAYEVHQRFVLKSVFFPNALANPNLNLYWFQFPGIGETYDVTNIRFLPVEQMRIVRNGNYFRIRGRLTFDIRRYVVPKKDLWVDYVCALVHDPELDVWRLSGNVEEIADNFAAKLQE